jgi:hypothetical protein
MGMGFRHLKLYLSQGSVTCASRRGLKLPSSTSAYGMTFCNAPREPNKGRRRYLSPLKAIVGMPADPAHKGAQASRRARNSDTALGPPKRTKGPCSNLPSPNWKSQFPSGVRMPHESKGIQSMLLPAPTYVHALCIQAQG